jgi:pyruvate/2-oxoglutarate/acetoin dehydrogenase E1 component
VSEVVTLTYTEAIEAAIAQEMREDSTVLCLGTALPAALSEEFGPSRMRITPISEPAVTGMAIGAAMRGKRPVVWWRSVTFAFVAFDQVVNQAAKARYMSGGQVACPVVFRSSTGGGFHLGAQHSQSPYSMLAHVPGLKSIVPSNARDAYGLLRAAIRDDNPVLCYEPSRLDGTTAAVPLDLVLPLGEAVVTRAGTDVTVVGVGYMAHAALAVADELAAEGISVEVVDVRSVVPLDVATIRQSVQRTHRLVIADEAPPMCSVASEVAAAVLEDAATFTELATSCVRVCAAPVPIPFSPRLEAAVLPGEASVVDAVRRVLAA